MATPIIGLGDSDAEGVETLMTADQAADAILEGIAAERFLILTHPEVQEYAALRGTDRQKWLDGMRRLRAAALREFGSARPEDFYKLV